MKWVAVHVRVPDVCTVCKEKQSLEQNVFTHCAYGQKAVVLSTIWVHVISRHLRGGETVSKVHLKAVSLLLWSCRYVRAQALQLG